MFTLIHCLPFAKFFDIISSFVDSSRRWYSEQLWRWNSYGHLTLWIEAFDNRGKNLCLSEMTSPYEYHSMVTLFGDRPDVDLYLKVKTSNGFLYPFTVSRRFNMDTHNYWIRETSRDHQKGDNMRIGIYCEMKLAGQKVAKRIELTNTYTDIALYKKRNRYRGKTATFDLLIVNKTDGEIIERLDIRFDS